MLTLDAFRVFLCATKCDTFGHKATRIMFHNFVDKSKCLGEQCEHRCESERVWKVPKFINRKMNYSVRNTVDENDDAGNNKFKLGFCVSVCVRLRLLRHSAVRFDQAIYLNFSTELI